MSRVSLTVAADFRAMPCPAAKRIPLAVCHQEKQPEINVKTYDDPSRPAKRKSGRLTSNLYIHFLLLCIILSVLLPAVNSFGADDDTMEPAGKIIFLPFTVQTEKPLQYLQNGLTDILATRLTRQTGLVAVHKSSETKQLATLMAKGDQQAFKDMLHKLDADYLVIGSLEQQNTSYEIMIYVFNRKRPTPSSFSKTIASLNGVIPAINEISIQIADQVFNQKNPEQPVATTVEDPGISGFQTAHPDRAYKEGLYQPAAIVGLDGDTFKVLSSRRSGKIKMKARAMTVGDLDGDGTEEIILVQTGSMIIYHLNDDHFELVAEQSIPGYLAPQAISLADLDKNGRLEMYIAANSGDKAASQVFEWDGSTFHLLFKNVPYYLRPGINLAGEQVLLGQRASHTGPVSRSFFTLVRTGNGSLEKDAEVMVPKGFNLFDFIRADLDGDGTPEFIGLTTGNRLTVMDATGNLLWQSDAQYGASKYFFGTLSSNRAGGSMPIYTHTRLIAGDQDGDGKSEIIVGRNRVTNIKFFNRLRYFEGSSISALSWDGTEMTTLWETKKIPNYTTDYMISSKNNRINDFQLFFIESDSSYPLFFWESESTIINLYEMGRNPESEQKD
jgi:TolB-like protein